MLKSTTLKAGLTLGLFFALHLTSAAQDVIARPSNVGNYTIDLFTSRSFDAYNESMKINTAMSKLKVETTAAKEVKVMDDKGQPLTKGNALMQLTELSARAAKQMLNIQEAQAMQPTVTQSIADASAMVKLKATKAVSKDNDALATAMTQTTNQTKMLQDQIAMVKTMKGE